MAFEAGQRVGDYEIVARLGAGGLGVVYEVRHLISKRREAMKILLPDQMGTPEMVERFLREVQTLAALNHPNIASLHTAFYHGDQLAMVMELIHGDTLSSLRLKSQITLPQLLEFAAQILQALTYAHGVGVVHRDIKPANIMIADNQVVKLLDFGIALTDKSANLTQTGYMLGSLNYMSPEQVSGGKATAQSDLYSVGVTLYELLAGTLPIAGNSNYEIMVGHMQRTPAPLHEVAPQVPLAISNAVMRSLAKKPEERFLSADEFLRALHLDHESKNHAAEVTLPLPSSAGRATSGSGGSPHHKVPSTSGIQSFLLEDVTRKLAVYIGPVARFVVKKLAAQNDDIDDIYREAAKQIGSDTDRAAFLRSKNHQG